MAAERLSKRFTVARRGAGVGAALRALVRRQHETVDAVLDLSLTIQAGERVGLLGPNGAGKTTTLKMLAGLLYPSAGSLKVLGHVPKLREAEFLRSIAMVMGQKRQLSWDLPAVDTFELHRVVYEIARVDYRRRLDELVTLLCAAEIISKPVRTLSLGERMKCELIAALLHSPRVLFLDEPTLGMDVSMQLAIREFIRHYNEDRGATVVLTSHYMEDVAALCPRIVVIDGGQLRFDGGIGELTRRIRPRRRIQVAADKIPEQGALAEFGEVIERDDAHLVLDVRPNAVATVVPELLALPGSRDLVVCDAPLEEVMRELFDRPTGESS
ncbi:MAG TPA: ATP-binding cassette domain-containing protein [Nannocystis exedens]|nr:ATP-binding cassette domain-containing protein [Nannocystis exedens]